MKLIEKEAIKARRIFEHHALEISDTLFRDFPRGCCGNVSLFFANRLTCLGVEGVKVIQGEKGDSSHSWVVVNDLIIDITADQFENQNHGIFPIDSPYHASYSDQSESSLDIGPFLAQSYEVFTAFINDR